MHEDRSSFEYQPTIIDSRRDLLISAPPDIKEIMVGRTEQLREFERQVAAQILPIEIRPIGDRTIITVRIPNYDQALYLPETQNRRQWESWKDEMNPAYEQNYQAAHDLETAVLKHRPVSQSYQLPHTRIALGTIYQFGEMDEEKLAIRINNDPNNIYSGWGNPYSSMIKTVKQGAHPLSISRASIEEVIPAVQDKDGRINAMWPEGFFKSRNHRRYKEKILAINGMEASTQSIPNVAWTEFAETKYDTSIDLAFDYSAHGNRRLYQIKNITPLLTPQGTLEIETRLKIDAPDYLLDPEFKSEIVIVKASKAADWTYRRLQGKSAEFELESVIDSQTGLPTTDSGRALHYRTHFQASPPLWNIFRQNYAQYERETS